MLSANVSIRPYSVSYTHLDVYKRQEWQEREELLRIDNLFREKLHYPLRMEALAQPWTEKDEQKSEHVLKLRFHIYSEVEMNEVELAMEHPETAEICWNGEALELSLIHI